MVHRFNEHWFSSSLQKKSDPVIPTDIVQSQENKNRVINACLFKAASVNHILKKEQWTTNESKQVLKTGYYRMNDLGKKPYTFLMLIQSVYVRPNTNKWITNEAILPEKWSVQILYTFNKIHRLKIKQACLTKASSHKWRILNWHYFKVTLYEPVRSNLTKAPFCLSTIMWHITYINARKLCQNSIPTDLQH